ncbi:MAG TPA: hypothetical protein PKH77_04065 [Anaerolineae bacterium]|nr:hypothetical protein [Anaerolineae bacterium]
MTEMTYHAIKPLLAREEVRGRGVYCTFRCPVSGFSINASATIEFSAGQQIADRAQKTIKRRMLSTARSAVTRSITKALGHNLLGQLGRDLTHTASMEITRKATQPAVSSAMREAAVVAAFEKVAGRFVWDKTHQRWIALNAGAETLSDFDRQVQTVPVTQAYDLGVLVRMLAEIANADRKVSAEEKALLTAFLPPTLEENVNELLRRPPLSGVELEETTAGLTRETLLMLAWGMALTDEKLAAQEQTRLTDFAAGLRVAPAREAELKNYAQSYVLEHFFAEAYAGGKFDARRQQRALQAAVDLGMTETEAERADVRYRKRAGVI